MLASITLDHLSTIALAIETKQKLADEINRAGGAVINRVIFLQSFLQMLLFKLDRLPLADGTSLLFTSHQKIVQTIGKIPRRLIFPLTPLARQQYHGQEPDDETCQESILEYEFGTNEDGYLSESDHVSYKH